MLRKMFVLSFIIAILANACTAVGLGNEPPVILTAKVEATGTQAARQTEAANNSFSLTATQYLNALNVTPGASNATPAPGATAGSSTTTTGTCPTRREVNDSLFGKNADGTSKDIVVQVSTEPGAWQVNTGDPSKNYTITLPNTTTTFVGTLHRVGVSKAEVFLGDGKNYTIFRGTFRFASCYDPSDDMRAANNAVRILVKENYNGTWQTWLNQKRIQDWTFSVLPGNFTCPTDVCPNPVPAATAPAPGATAVPAAAPSCPTFGGIQTTPGNDGGPYCKYLGSVVTDKVPAGWKAHYWDGKAAQFADPNTTVTTGNATFRRP